MSTFMLSWKISKLIHSCYKIRKKTKLFEYRSDNKTYVRISKRQSKVYLKPTSQVRFRKAQQYNELIREFNLNTELFKNKKDYIKLRANADSKALKFRFSDSMIFQKNQPKNPALKKIYELSEIMRCEMLGSNMLNGIKKNLENNYYQKINNEKNNNLNSKEETSVLDAFELYILEKFFTN